MADGNFSTTTEDRLSKSQKSREALNEVLMGLGRINGVVDCLYTLASDDLNCGMDLGLCKGSLHITLDALLHQIEETHNFLMEVEI